MNERIDVAWINEENTVIVRGGINSYNSVIIRRQIPPRPDPLSRPCPFRLLEPCQFWIGDEKAEQCWSCYKDGRSGREQLELEARDSRITQEFVLHALEVAERILARTTPEFRPTDAFVTSKRTYLGARDLAEGRLWSPARGTELFFAFRILQEAISCALLPAEARWLASSIRSMTGGKRLVKKTDEALEEYEAEIQEAWQFATRRGWLYPKFVEPERLREGFKIELEKLTRS